MNQRGEGGGGGGGGCSCTQLLNNDCYLYSCMTGNAILMHTLYV